MIINNDKKYVFICVAKTGSTSMRRMLGSFVDPPPEIYHMFLSEVLNKHPETKDYFKFAFVRDPYTRLHSAWSNFKHDEGHPWDKEIKRIENFENFILNLENSEYFKYVHLRPQVEYLKVDNNIKLDFIGRFENYEEDCYKIFDILDIEMKDIVKTRVSKKLDKLFYTKEMKDVVLKLYKEDFEVFGYEK